MIEVLGYQFKEPELLNQALTHSSFANEGSASSDNERLEFLGDAVVGLVVAQILMKLYPEACEGQLSRWRSSLVSRKTLAEIAATMRLGEYLRLGRGERRTGGAEKPSILAAGLEAVVGALYLDGGIDPVTAFLNRIYAPFVAALSTFKTFKDNKTALQEITQARHKTLPAYHIVAKAGSTPHEPLFHADVLLAGRVLASGCGRSRKEAEQIAAGIAVQELTGGQP